MDNQVRVELARGREAERWLGEVATLRIAVFRDWPYLYAGDLDYEREYLATYTRSPDNVFVLVFAGDKVIGASTGLPLNDETPAFQAPFVARGLPVADVFYFGESVLLPEYRGLGLGHAFFDHREVHARALGRFAFTAFDAVDRAEDDPRRPPGHRTNDAFWQKRGYQRQPDMQMQLDWDEIGIGEINHSLTFWLRPLEPRP